MVDTNQRKSGIDGRLRRHEGGFAAGDGVCILKKHQLRQLAQRFYASFSTELAGSSRPKADHQFDGFHAQSEKFDHLQ